MCSSLARRQRSALLPSAWLLAGHRKAAMSVLGVVNGETASGHLALQPGLLHHLEICTPCYHWPCRKGRLPLL